MERTKKTTAIRWKKIGGGSLRLNKRIIKPGEIFYAEESDIPKSMRDVIVPMEELPSETKEEVKVKPTEFNMVPRGGSNTWFDIVDSTGKVLNEKALTRVTAEQFLKDLS